MTSSSILKELLLNNDALISSWL